MSDATFSRTIATVRQTLQEVATEVDVCFDKAEEVRCCRPRGGGWNINEVLEHITLTNHYLLLVIRKSSSKALERVERGVPIPSEESNLQILDPIGQRGSFSWPRPEHMEPTKAKSSVEVRSLMRDQFRECLSLLDRLKQGEGSLVLVRMSVNDSGKLDVYQWLQFLALHAKRHLAQMAENEAAWKDEREGYASITLI